jgi:hypothetical protein
MTILKQIEHVSIRIVGAPGDALEVWAKLDAQIEQYGKTHFAVLRFNDRWWAAIKNHTSDNYRMWQSANTLEELRELLREDFAGKYT